jgi:hypothetical protein
MLNVPENSPIPGLLGTSQLRTTARVVVGALVAYCIYQGRHLRGWELELSLACLGLAVWPALRWINTQPYRFPAFESFMLTSVTAYVLPLINEHSVVMSYSDEIVTKAVLAVILFQVCAIIAFQRTVALERRAPFWKKDLFVSDIRNWLPLGLWLHVGYLSLGTFTQFVPDEIDSILRAIFFGISISCSFLIGRYWGDNSLSINQKSNVVFAMLIEVILQLTTLYLISAISGLIVFFLAYVSAGRRIPWAAIWLSFAVFSVLHNGKSAMREKYWAGGAALPGVTDLPAFFSEWVGYGLAPQRDENDAPHSSKLLERASLLQMLCLVIDSTDRGLPLLGGETYSYIPAQLVPRIMWPGKPSGQAATMRLSIYFGLQDEFSTRSTSIAFGTLTEAYANFGFAGMAVFGLLVGWVTKVISMWTRSCPLLSNGSLIMILIVAWSIQTELPLSVWFASLYQALICVLALPFVVRLFVV